MQGDDDGWPPKKESQSGLYDQRRRRSVQAASADFAFVRTRGFAKPSRSQGNTRLYTDSDLERLEVILNLTRELGVNLAGIEIILNMRDKMADMQSQMEDFIKFVRNEMARSFTAADNPKARHAIVRAVPRPVLRVEK